MNEWEFIGDVLSMRQYVKEHNQVRPHSSLGYRPPAPDTKMSLTLTIGSGILCERRSFLK